MADTEAADLLVEMGALRRRTRADRHGYWLPLLFFGVLVLAAPLAYTRPTLIPLGGGMFTVADADRIPFGFPIGSFYVEPLAAFRGVVPSQFGALYWLAAVVIGLLASVVWYRWRANRVGVQPRITTYLWPAFGALALFVVVCPLSSIVLFTAFRGFGQIGFWVDLAIAVVGIGIVVLSAVRRGRRGRMSLPRRIGLVGGIVIAAFGLGNLSILATLMGFGALYVIALGLVALAWMERSVACAVIAALFFAASLLANLYDVENWLGIDVDPFMGGTKLFVLIHVALPAAVLIIGGIVALVTSRLSRAAR